MCRPGCLDSYEEHIRALAERFPKYWGVIVKADDLMRSDRWARELQWITTQVEKNRPLRTDSDFDPQHPWECVIESSVLTIVGG